MEDITHAHPHEHRAESLKRERLTAEIRNATS